MATVIDQEFNKFKHVYVQPSVVHCDPKRKGDCVPIAFCQVQGWAMEAVYTCCPKNKYHFLIDGGADKKITDLASFLQQKNQISCPTCKRENVDTRLSAQHDPEVEQNVKSYYEHQYNKLMPNELKCHKTGEPLLTPIVLCDIEMHCFVNSVQAYQTCPIDEWHGKAQDLEVHPFLNYAIEKPLKNEYMEGREGKFEGFITNACFVLTHNPIPLCPRSLTHWIASPKESEQLIEHQINFCHCTAAFYPPNERAVHPVLQRVNMRYTADSDDQVPDLSAPSGNSPSAPDKPQKPPVLAPPANKTKGSCRKTLKRICTTAATVIICIALIILVGVIFICYKERIFSYRLSR